jgi:hypothetical protein
VGPPSISAHTRVYAYASGRASGACAAGARAAAATRGSRARVFGRVCARSDARRDGRGQTRARRQRRQRTGDGDGSRALLDRGERRRADHAPNGVSPCPMPRGRRLVGGVQVLARACPPAREARWQRREGTRSASLRAHDAARPALSGLSSAPFGARGSHGLTRHSAASLRARRRGGTGEDKCVHDGNERVTSVRRDGSRALLEGRCAGPVAHLTASARLVLGAARCMDTHYDGSSRTASELSSAPPGSRGSVSQSRGPGRVPARARCAARDRRHSGVVSWGQKRLLEPQPLGRASLGFAWRDGARLCALTVSVSGRRSSRCVARANEGTRAQAALPCASGRASGSDEERMFALPSWEKSSQADERVRTKEDEGPTSLRSIHLLRYAAPAHARPSQRSRNVGA